MRVRATKTGYYDHIRRFAGAIFDIASEAHFSPNWMERAGEARRADEPREAGARKPREFDGRIAARNASGPVA